MKYVIGFLQQYVSSVQKGNFLMTSKPCKVQYASKGVGLNQLYKRARIPDTNLKRTRHFFSIFIFFFFCVVMFEFMTLLVPR